MFRPQLVRISRRFISGIPFPIKWTSGKAPNTLFCHGLGSAWDLPTPLRYHEYVQSMGYQFTRFQYRFIGDLTRVWHVDTWVEDIVTLLDYFYAKSGPVNVFACSAGAQAALRAVLERPSQVRSLLLLAPGVGLDLGYMDRVEPGSSKILLSGKQLIHPGLKGGACALLELEDLLDYGRKCPLNTMETIPITCPVGIMHGYDDGLVPFENSVKLAEKLQSTNVQLVLCENQGHIFEFNEGTRRMIDKFLLS